MVEGEAFVQLNQPEIVCTEDFEGEALCKQPLMNGTVVINNGATTQ